MGCASQRGQTIEEKKSKQIDSDIRKVGQGSPLTTLLFLGTGESGTSKWVYSY